MLYFIHSKQHIIDQSDLTKIRNKKSIQAYNTGDKYEKLNIVWKANRQVIKIAV